MWRYLFIGVSLIGLATQAPALLQEAVEARDAKEVSAPADRVARAEEPVKSRKSHNPLAGREARIDRDRRGHYVARARLNGRSFDVLVDTGATMIALNESTARRIGIRLKPSDFRYRVRTANGVAEAAKAMIDEIEIGRVIVHDVPATIARDGALSTVLLGMSFLNKLKKFEFEAGTLVLVQ